MSHLGHRTPPHTHTHTYTHKEEEEEEEETCQCVVVVVFSCEFFYILFCIISFIFLLGVICLNLVHWFISVVA